MGGFITMMFYIEPTDVYHAWCSPYLRFCIFSEGRATNLTEAHAKCNEIKKQSWPVEIDKAEVEVILNEYVTNYSISNVILNSVKDDSDNWHWSSGQDVYFDYYYISRGDDYLVFNRNDSVSDYAVVCSTECLADWTDIDNVHLGDTDSRLRAFATLEDCKRDCEEFPNCSSVDYEHKSSLFGMACKQNLHRYNILKRYEHPRGSHHVIDRSNKTVQLCIGDYDGKKPTFDWSLLFILLNFLGVLMLICILLISMNLGERVQFLSSGRSTISQGPSII